MRSLQISDNDLIGNKFNGHELHLLLQKSGVHADSMVFNKQSDDPSTKLIAAHDSERSRTRDFIKTIEHEYSLHAMLYPFAADIIRSPEFVESDIVHLHLIHNYFFDIRMIPLISRLKPLVWTLHDPWAVTGHCIHPQQCGNWKEGCRDCPDLNTPFHFFEDTTSLNWEIKRSLLSEIEMDIIVASEWMKNIAITSPIFKNSRIHLIPFGVDPKVFFEGEKTKARERLDIPENGIIVAFRSDINPFKGIDFIKESLRAIKTVPDVHLLLVGQKGNFEEFKKVFNVKEFGWVGDDTILADIYRASDLLLMPSTAETFGMMAVESMACGTPVLTIKGTSLERVTGYPDCGIATERDVREYSAELVRLLSNREELSKRGHASAGFAKTNYDIDAYLDSIQNVYRAAIDAHETDKWAERLIAELAKGINIHHGTGRSPGESAINYGKFAGGSHRRMPVLIRILRKIVIDFMPPILFRFIKRVIRK